MRFQAELGLRFVALDLKSNLHCIPIAGAPPLHSSAAPGLCGIGVTRTFLHPAGDPRSAFCQGTITSASFEAGEIILPNAFRKQRGRLTPPANIPLEVIAVQAKDVNLIHLLARCKKRQLDRHQEQVERFKKWRWSR